MLGVPGGAAPDLQTIGYLLSRLPEGADWSMLGIGRHQLEVNVLSLLYGGHVRTGLEDNVYYRRGELARSNAQLVERVVRLAEEFGRPVASPGEARKLLGVRAPLNRYSGDPRSVEPSSTPVTRPPEPPRHTPNQ